VAAVKVRLENRQTCDGNCYTLRSDSYVSVSALTVAAPSLSFFFDCVEAASHGHLDTLMWLCAQGCSMMYNPEAMLHAAAKGGSIEVMEYILQQGVVSESTHLTDMLQAAGAYKRLAAAQWLRQQGAEWPDSLTYYWRGRCKRWKGEVLAWARAQGCTASQDTDSEYGSGSESDD
jgi:hypothetical protein